MTLNAFVSYPIDTEILCYTTLKMPFYKELHENI